MPFRLDPRRLACSGLAAGLLAGCAGTPAPLAEDVAERVARQQAAMAELRSTLPEQAMDAETAVAYAAGHNLEVRLATLDRALAAGAIDLASVQMLPSLSVQAGYLKRDQVEAGSGDPLGRHTRSAELSWGALEFGSAWLRTREAGERGLIYARREREQLGRIAIETRLAWLRVANAERRGAQVAEAERLLVHSEALLARLEAASLRDPLVHAQYRDGLLALRSQLRAVGDQASAARGELAGLLASDRRQPPRVAADAAQQDALLATVTAALAIPEDTLETHALRHRADLRELDVQARILRREAQLTWLNALPVLRLFYGRQYDTDLKLDPPYWQQQGYSLAFNLLGLASAALQHRQLGVQRGQTDLRQLALGFAAVEQVRLGRERLALALADWRDAEARRASSARIAAIRLARTPFYEDDELDQARAQVTALQAGVAADRAWETLLERYLQLLQASGVDVWPDALPAFDADRPLEATAEALRRHWQALPQRVAELAREVD